MTIIERSFLVSFMVDARGGAMRGTRHSGIRIVIPPGKASMPTRILCRLIKKEKLLRPPVLNEGEALANRIIEMGPHGTKFLGPVLIEVPHFASLRDKEREIQILRSDNGDTWYDHPMIATEDAVAQAMAGTFEEFEGEDDLAGKRITRILTEDLPQYFALVTRVRAENQSIGEEGGVISSKVVPQVQAVFPQGALKKNIRVGLQAQPIAPETITKLFGNRVACSPIVTLEPRRRKFHKAITLTIPVPKAAQKGMINQYQKENPSLRILCSITGGANAAVWEDITDNKNLTFTNGCVSFITTVSARFWLMDCQVTQEAASMAMEIYHEAVTVPYMARFVVFAKRTAVEEGQLRMFCMTDDRIDKTLEKQQNFVEVARSRDVEVLEGRPQFIEMAGNLIPVTKSGDQLFIDFKAFRENRLPCTVRVRDQDQEPAARVAFMKEPKVARGEVPQTPICNLNITMTGWSKSSSMELQADDSLEVRKRHSLLREHGIVLSDSISRAQVKLTDVADTLQGDWIILAQQLDITGSEINQIKSDYNTVNDQALAMLQLWVEKKKEDATGNSLENGLRQVGREDVIKKAMYNVEVVEDELEAAAARTAMDQSGFDNFAEEVGISRDSSLKKGMSLDVEYDEKDMVKESESANEESSEEDKRESRVAPQAPIEGYTDTNLDDIVAEVDERRKVASSTESTAPMSEDKKQAYIDLIFALDKFEDERESRVAKDKPEELDDTTSVGEDTVVQEQKPKEETVFSRLEAFGVEAEMRQAPPVPSDEPKAPKSPEDEKARASAIDQLAARLSEPKEDKKEGESGHVSLNPPDSYGQSDTSSVVETIHMESIESVHASLPIQKQTFSDAQPTYIVSNQKDTDSSLTYSGIDNKDSIPMSPVPELNRLVAFNKDETEIFFDTLETQPNIDETSGIDSDQSLGESSDSRAKERKRVTFAASVIDNEKIYSESSSSSSDSDTSDSSDDEFEGHYVVVPNIQIHNTSDLKPLPQLDGQENVLTTDLDDDADELEVSKPTYQSLVPDANNFTIPDPRTPDFLHEEEQYFMNPDFEFIEKEHTDENIDPDNLRHDTDLVNPERTESDDGCEELDRNRKNIDTITSDEPEGDKDHKRSLSSSSSDNEQKDNVERMSMPLETEENKSIDPFLIDEKDRETLMMEISCDRPIFPNVTTAQDDTEDTRTGIQTEIRQDVEHVHERSASYSSSSSTSDQNDDVSFQIELKEGENPSKMYSHKETIIPDETNEENDITDVKITSADELKVGVKQNKKCPQSPSVSSSDNGHDVIDEQRLMRDDDCKPNVGGLKDDHYINATETDLDTQLVFKDRILNETDIDSEMILPKNKFETASAIKTFNKSPSDDNVDMPKNQELTPKEITAVKMEHGRFVDPLVTDLDSEMQFEHQVMRDTEVDSEVIVADIPHGQNCKDLHRIPPYIDDISCPKISVGNKIEPAPLIEDHQILPDSKVLKPLVSSSENESSSPNSEAEKGSKSSDIGSEHKQNEYEDSTVELECEKPKVSPIKHQDSRNIEFRNDNETEEYENADIPIPMTRDIMNFPFCTSVDQDSSDSEPADIPVPMTRDIMNFPFCTSVDQDSSDSESDIKHDACPLDDEKIQSQIKINVKNKDQNVIKSKSIPTVEDATDTSDNESENAKDSSEDDNSDVDTIRPLVSTSLNKSKPISYDKKLVKLPESEHVQEREVEEENTSDNPKNIPQEEKSISETDSESEHEIVPSSHGDRDKEKTLPLQPKLDHVKRKYSSSSSDSEPDQKNKSSSSDEDQEHLKELKNTSYSNSDPKEIIETDLDAIYNNKPIDDGATSESIKEAVKNVKDVATIEPIVTDLDVEMTLPETDLVETNIDSYGSGSQKTTIDIVKISSEVLSKDLPLHASSFNRSDKEINRVESFIVTEDPVTYVPSKSHEIVLTTTDPAAVEDSLSSSSSSSEDEGEKKGDKPEETLSKLDELPKEMSHLDKEEDTVLPSIKSFDDTNREYAISPTTSFSDIGLGRPEYVLPEYVAEQYHSAIPVESPPGQKGPPPDEVYCETTLTVVRRVKVKQKYETDRTERQLTTNIERSAANNEHRPQTEHATEPSERTHKRSRSPASSDSDSLNHPSKRFELDHIPKHQHQTNPPAREYIVRETPANIIVGNTRIIETYVREPQYVPSRHSSSSSSSSDSDMEAKMFDVQEGADEDLSETAEGGDTQTTRITMKKEIHTKTVLKDGQEQTFVHEDSQVEQDPNAPEELRESMQQIIDEFMGSPTEAQKQLQHDV